MSLTYICNTKRKVVNRCRIAAGKRGVRNPSSANFQGAESASAKGGDPAQRHLLHRVPRDDAERGAEHDRVQREDRRPQGSQTGDICRLCVTLNGRKLSWKTLQRFFQPEGRRGGPVGKIYGSNGAAHSRLFKSKIDQQRPFISLAKLGWLPVYAIELHAYPISHLGRLVCLRRCD